MTLFVEWSLSFKIHLLPWELHCSPQMQKNNKMCRKSSLHFRKQAPHCHDKQPSSLTPSSSLFFSSEFCDLQFRSPDVLSVSIICEIAWSLFDFRISQQCLCRQPSSGMQRRVIRWTPTDVSEEQTVCCMILVSFLKMETRNICWLSPDYMPLYPRRQKYVAHALVVFMYVTVKLR
jgi:hypothetical protein